MNIDDTEIDESLERAYKVSQIMKHKNSQSQIEYLQHLSYRLGRVEELLVKLIKELEKE